MPKENTAKSKVSSKKLELDENLHHSLRQKKNPIPFFSKIMSDIYKNQKKTKNKTQLQSTK